MTRMLAGLVAIALVLGGQCCAAGTLSLQVPKSSSLELVKLEQPELIATFGGEVQVAARLVAQWVPDIDETEPTNQVFSIEIDESVPNTLPFFEGYPVRTIGIKSGLEALRKAVGEQAYRDFSLKKSLKVEATVVFRIKSFVVGVGCDSSWARAELIDFIQPRSKAVPIDHRPANRSKRLLSPAHVCSHEKTVPPLSEQSHGQEAA